MWTLVSVGPSTSRTKKLMAVFRDGPRRKTVHFGARGYNDFTTYWKIDPNIAKQHRASYIRRHATRENWADPTTPGALSRFILWEKKTIPLAIRAFRSRFQGVHMFTRKSL